MSWTDTVALEVPLWLTWAALVPVIAFITRRARGPLSVRLVEHLAAGIVIALTQTAALTIARSLLSGSGMPSFPVIAQTSLGVARSWLLFQLVMYGAIVGSVLAFDARRREQERTRVAAELAAQLSQAQLTALRMQLNPHFLFNALNTAVMLVRQNSNPEALRVLVGLSQLLRTALEAPVESHVPLRVELDFVTRYLELEQARFSDRLSVGLAVDASVLDSRVPSFVLQPLVENAIRHGIARRAASGRIDLAARRDGNTLVLTVADDGPGPHAVPSEPSTGVGLANTRARLAMMYGSDASLEIAEQPAGFGTIATVALPLAPA